MKALYGLEFAPILSIGSGFLCDPLVGMDSNHEHIFPFAARPMGYGRDTLATPPNVNFDFRALKMVGIKGGHLDFVAESFNIVNHENITELDPVYGNEPAKRRRLRQADCGRHCAADSVLARLRILKTAFSQRRRAKA
ncbi:MAG TPA: hypothetical protein VFA99_16135 [Acidobacteriaceae bacterium]|nr:hypothetical protein [Acidobacteriaceae bacterium]